MKILLAIESTDYKNLPDRALRWCGRSGFAVKVFVAKNKRRKYSDVIPEVNYQWYLALPLDTIVSRYGAIEYAKKFGYDLLLTVPEHLTAWRKGMMLKDNEIVLMRAAVGKARIEFGEKPKMSIKRFPNGSIMRRVSMINGKD